MTSLSNDYELLDCIGHGTFGRVHLATHIPTSTTVAIKIIPLIHSPSLSTLRSEIESLKMACSHANIVKYFNSLVAGGEVWIVMEYCELGSLRGFIEDKDEKEGAGLDEAVVWYVAMCVLEALAFLHRRNIIHRDLKAANILVTKDHVIKLADFGVAITDDKQISEVAGSPYWMAPEVIKEHKSSFASDIWSFGITMIELFTGNPPYSESSPAAAVRKIASDMPPVLGTGSQELRRMVERCLHDDPLQRPTATELLAQMKRVDSKPFRELCSTASPITRMKNAPPIEADRRTLMSEWTFGATISSDFTLKTWLEDITTPTNIDARLWERQRVWQDETSQMVSPVWSPSTQLGGTDTIRTGDEGMAGKKLLTSSLELKTTYSEQEMSSLMELVKAKKLACPHICPKLDTPSPFTELVKSGTTQTEEQRKESNKIDQLILGHGPVKASLEYVRERRGALDECE